MLPLPPVSYEPAVWSQATVRNDYLVSDGKNKYSVPFDLIVQKVQIRLTKYTVEIFSKGERIASHRRLEYIQSQPVVKTEHMPENYRRYLNYNTDEFIRQANEIGENTTKVVEYFLSSGNVPEQGYKSCVSVLKLSEKYGRKKLENACECMLTFSSVPSVRNITSLLKNSKAYENATVNQDNSNKYGITRGADYFRKDGDHND